VAGKINYVKLKQEDNKMTLFTPIIYGDDQVLAVMCTNQLTGVTATLSSEVADLIKAIEEKVVTGKDSYEDAEKLISINPEAYFAFVD
jgi:hypothetical protein